MTDESLELRDERCEMREERCGMRHERCGMRDESWSFDVGKWKANEKKFRQCIIFNCFGNFQKLEVLDDHQLFFVKEWNVWNVFLKFGKVFFVKD